MHLLLQSDYLHRVIGFKTFSVVTIPSLLIISCVILRMVYFFRSIVDFTLVLIH